MFGIFDVFVCFFCGFSNRGTSGQGGDGHGKTAFGYIWNQFYSIGDDPKSQPSGR